ncbi:hypothetical protein [Streptomyces sp. NBC_01233]|uniref:hypothetical protein n=1 Tax=Streptomyces sp. NBC_01233 TaxID=2903787 RepID=UPI002E0F2D70|nr:hypothetical protein OG332_18535 [Streptomyces sp. NBC_01233]
MRHYHRVTIQCRVQIRTEHIRVDETEEDRQIDPSTGRQRFNRTERLRPVPPDAPTWKRRRHGLQMRIKHHPLH